MVQVLFHLSDNCSDFEQIFKDTRSIWARPQSGIRVTTPLNRKFFDSVSKLYGTQQYLKVKKIPGSDALIVQFSGNFPFVQFESTLGVSDPPG